VRVVVVSLSYVVVVVVVVVVVAPTNQAGAYAHYSNNAPTRLIIMSRHIICHV